MRSENNAVEEEGKHRLTSSVSEHMSYDKLEKELSIPNEISSKTSSSKSLADCKNADVKDANCEKEEYSAFSSTRKAIILGIVTFAGFLGPASGNIYIPILPLLQREFRVSSTCINATVSVFMFTFAFAPLFWSSWADFGGRKTLYLISLLVFLLANLLLAVLPANIGALFVLRIVQAFGASSVMSVGAGTVSDIFEPAKRARAISYFMLGPQLGPVIGPIISTIASNNQWRWTFGFLAIATSVVYIAILFLLPETLRYLVGNGSILQEKGLIVVPKFFQNRIVQDEKKFPKPPKPRFVNFWKMLKFKPVLLCSINCGILFASFYGMSVTFTRVLRNDYNFSTLNACLAYICPGVSLVTGSIIGGRISDHLRKKIVALSTRNYIPENRFSIQIVGFIVSTAGILGYGWCCQMHVHVVAIFVFTFLSGFGMTWVFVTTTTYLTECSSGQPATNVALGNLMRNLSAAISSLIIEKLIEKMTFGWCFTGLALINLIGITFVIVLLLFGKKWREEFDART